MADRPRLLSAVVTAVIVSVSQTGSAEAAKRSAISVLVYDCAPVSRQTLDRASERVRRIYREINVEVVWIDPLKDRQFLMMNPMSNSTGTFVIQIMIRLHRASEPTSAPESVMGMAPEAGEHGGTASVFYDQVLRMAHHYRQPVEDLLAIAVAHEMGHVLLPPPGHAPTGIMRAVWDGRDIRHAVLGSLTFTPTQAALIQAKVSGCCSHATK
jgi:hypothetical protein